MVWATFWALFSLKICYKIWLNYGLATFWAIFSQKHLVTLCGKKVKSSCLSEQTEDSRQKTKKL
jgi:hypothetical protein